MKLIKLIPLILCFLSVFENEIYAQSMRSDFWDRVQYGGGLGINFGNNYFALNIAPSAIYNFNDYFALGPGLSYSYVKNGNFKSSITGGSVIALFNPLQKIQLSAELEELYVNQEFSTESLKRDFWNTALFLGAGFRSGFTTIGVRYNVLYDNSNEIYTSAVQPFIRFYF